MDLDGYIRFIVALVFVLGLIGLLTWLVRKLGIGGKVAAASARGGARAGARLGVVEAATLDGRRKLVLIRRDDREHLVILGADGETVVERGIEPPAGAPDEAAEEPKTDFRGILGGLAGGNTGPAPARTQDLDTEPAPEPEPPAKPAKRRAARRSQRAAARKAS